MQFAKYRLLCFVYRESKLLFAMCEWIQIEKRKVWESQWWFGKLWGSKRWRKGLFEMQIRVLLVEWTVLCNDNAKLPTERGQCGQMWNMLSQFLRWLKRVLPISERARLFGVRVKHEQLCAVWVRKDSAERPVSIEWRWQLLVPQPTRQHVWAMHQWVLLVQQWDIAPQQNNAVVDFLLQRIECPRYQKILRWDLGWNV